MPSAEEIYLFRHAAYRDVAYRLQLPSDRAELHALALEIMEQVFQFDLDTFAYELAEHARFAREQGSPDSARLAASEAGYVMTALTRTVGRAQWEIVVTLCEQARPCPALSHKQLITLMREHGRALRELGRVQDALEVLRVMMERAREFGDVTGLVSALSESGSILLWKGDREQGNVLLEEAEPLAEQLARDGNPDQLVMLCLHRAHALTEFHEVEAMLTRAMDVLADHPDSHLVGVVKGNFANLYGSAGRHEEAIAELEVVLAEFMRRGETRNTSIAWANIGRQRLLLGRNEEAEEALGQSMLVAAEVGNTRTEAFARANLATLQMRRGALEQAAQNIARAIQIARDYELITYHASYLCNEAELQLLRGHEREAQELVERARAEFMASGAEAFVAEYCGILRLRIAASLASSTLAPGRATSTIKPAPPSPMWLPVMREIQTQLHRTHETKGNRGGILLEQGAKAGADLLAEIEAAVREQRPALVFRGHLPDELRPELRARLLNQLTEGEAAALRTLHPTLWNALSS
ncbi:MAG: hypothetical protein K8I27_10715 [Planctomycetes bacterium]|nr:hypothetical protein [Planctomycetota bacterium]